jgi:hypothetical protein
VVALSYILGVFDAIISVKPHESSISFPFEMMNGVNTFMLELCCLFADSNALEEYKDDDDDDYDMKKHGEPTEEEANILSDLSLLPRAK